MIYDELLKFWSLWFGQSSSPINEEIIQWLATGGTIFVVAACIIFPLIKLWRSVFR